MISDDGEGWWSALVQYGEAVYARRCPRCARFVRCDDKALLRSESAEIFQPNATCRRHGRVVTPFLAWADDCQPRENERMQR